MNLLEALEVVHLDRKKMARPVGDYNPPIGIYFDPLYGWAWSSGNRVRLPNPRLVFGEWEVVPLDLSVPRFSYGNALAALSRAR